jgi:predicted adenine nucleotide alpha hydrolase (AANH) superfamily ATPase
MKVALHICCAVCAAGAVERLLQEGHQVSGLFYNPNIHPEGEYQRRLFNARQAGRELGFILTEGPYRPADWHQAVRSLEDEPEGGKRCPVCIRIRLEKTYHFMQEYGCGAFATTLTMGSNKSAELIARIGGEIGGDTFLALDFKKKGGLKRTSELARKWGLYRQHYCGCVYSLRKLDI